MGNMSDMILRRFIRRILTESATGKVDVGHRYYPGTKKSLMLTEPGIEKEQRDKIYDYLSKIGLIKAPEDHI